MSNLIEKELEGYKLLAPASFWNASCEERAAVSNGCGPKGAGWMIPDKFMGCSFELPCDIHDWMYKHGKTKKDKQEADLVFLNNLMRVVEKEGGILSYMRAQRAWTYYRMVRDFGHSAFWKGKK